MFKRNENISIINLIAILIQVQSNCSPLGTLDVISNIRYNFQIDWVTT